MASDLDEVDAAEIDQMVGILEQSIKEVLREV